VVQKFGGHHLASTKNILGLNIKTAGFRARIPSTYLYITVIVQCYLQDLLVNRLHICHALWIYARCTVPEQFWYAGRLQLLWRDHQRWQWALSRSQNCQCVNGTFKHCTPGFLAAGRRARGLRGWSTLSPAHTACNCRSLFTIMSGGPSLGFIVDVLVSALPTNIASYVQRILDDSSGDPRFQGSHVRTVARVHHCGSEHVPQCQQQTVNVFVDSIRLGPT
jgi:hypothetical protein